MISQEEFLKDALVFGFSIIEPSSEKHFHKQLIRGVNEFTTYIIDTFCTLNGSLNDPKCFTLEFYFLCRSVPDDKFISLEVQSKMLALKIFNNMNAFNALIDNIEKMNDQYEIDIYNSMCEDDLLVKAPLGNFKGSLKKSILSEIVRALTGIFEEEREYDGSVHDASDATIRIDFIAEEHNG